MKISHAILILLTCNLGLSVVYADWDDITITQDTEISDGDQYVQVFVRSVDQITTVNVTGGTFRPNYCNYHPENNDGGLLPKNCPI